ncbi:hypothetical protein [Jatrophihabitans sp.]|uniref:hypothetical protein n=1 Tax=Jatrophihabitans sp. TaxID=1932789 RepID=UPI0030C6D11F|nr:hypothetical protein [Jatrophihabitans sp.]
MTAVSDRAAIELQRPGTPRPRLRPAAVDLGPALFVLANSIAFLIVRPGVNDLWAARARASAAAHGVGLTYWFSWFGGGATPGNYSVLTPYVSAVIGAEMLGALCALAISAGAWLLLRGSAHPTAAAAVVAVGVSANLWSGRIPFLFGTLFAVLAFAAARARRPALAAALGIVCVFCSPVAGAFLALGLGGTFISEPTKHYRRICLTTIAAVFVALVFVAVAFGNPGPENFSLWLTLELLGGLALCLLAKPAPWVRTTIWLSFVVVVLLFLIPNGLGSNIMRWGWFYVPVAVVATSSRRLLISLALVATLVGAGVQATVADLINSSDPTSTVAFYQPLARELDTLPGLATYRLEVVAHGFSHGSHAGDEALLNHAMLARGWETQEDQALNAILGSKSLDAVSFKAWLDNNAVGYVAIPRQQVKSSPEYDIIADQTPGYLHQIWQSVDWRLFRVSDASAVVQAPATVIARGQARLEVSIPCTCAIALRLRYSKFLQAQLVGSGIPARITNDGSGFSIVTTTRPGRYYLQGKLSGLFN